jgi:hypothetical protein
VKIHHAQKLLWIFLLCLIAVANGCADTSTMPSPMFSEDFESGKLSTNIWSQTITGGNVIAVQSEKAAHGNYALRVSCPATTNNTSAFIRAAHLPKALRQHFFGRACLFVTPKPPNRHTVFITAGTPGFPRKYQEVATVRGQWQLTYVDWRSNGIMEDYHSGGAIPLDRWFCLEWEFNDHPNHATVWVDGKLAYETGFIHKTTGATNDLVGGFDEFAFGFRLWAGAPQAFDVYYDDIALDPKRIGPVHEDHAEK